MKSLTFSNKILNESPIFTMKILSRIHQVKDTELDDSYILYDNGTIVHEYDKSRYPGRQNLKDELNADELDEEIKELLFSRAAVDNKPLVANILRIEGYQNLDVLFCDGASQSYYQGCTNLLAEKLPTSTLQSIRNNNITLLMSLSPGNVLSNFIFPANQTPQPAHIIIMDQNLIKYCGFNVQEIAALLLHELGHIFNYVEDNAQKEFYADYFAKKNGFGVNLSSALRKLQSKALDFIPSEFRKEVGDRINALDDYAQKPLLGITRNLNQPNNE
jgi:predicted Zn-dependent protease with MMP-like domain